MESTGIIPRVVVALVVLNVIKIRQPLVHKYFYKSLFPLNIFVLHCITGGLMLFLYTTIAFAHKPSFGEDFKILLKTHSLSMIQTYQSSYTKALPVNPLNCGWNLKRRTILNSTCNWGFQLSLVSQNTPNVAVIAEGLPTDVDIPFSLPENMGAMVFDSDPTPTEFFEPFTQTESWVWVEERITVSGSGYIVEWHPEGYTGKFGYHQRSRGFF